MNEAQRLHEQLGVHDPKVVYPKVVYPKFRYATSERQMRKGEDGQRKPGAYGKGLRNWCNRKPSKGRV